jgi:TatA/E family protein of Tat protein translocase
MIGSLGFTEIVFILVLALLVFGPKRLPEVGRTLGRGMKEFRRATSDLKRSIEQEIDLSDEPPRHQGPRQVGPSSTESRSDGS